MSEASSDAASFARLIHSVNTILTDYISSLEKFLVLTWTMTFIDRAKTSIKPWMPASKGSLMVEKLVRF